GGRGLQPVDRLTQRVGTKDIPVVRRIQASRVPAFASSRTVRLLSLGANYRTQARAARRREPPADARLFQTPPPPDLRCRVPCRNRSRPLAHLRRAVSSSTCHRALCMVE